jgi:hypothetical protein
MRLLGTPVCKHRSVAAEVLGEQTLSDTLHDGDSLPSEAAFVVILTGHAGAGKSELAGLVQRRNPTVTSVVSFKDAIASSIDDPPGKWHQMPLHTALIEAGEAWVERDPEGLVEAVLAQYDRRPILFVESVHHPKILRILKDRLSRSVIRSVMVKASEDMVIRAAQEVGSTASRAEEVLNNPVERPVEPGLLAVVDMVLDATLPPEENVERLAGLLKTMEGPQTADFDDDDFVGGLSLIQRQSLVGRVASEFKWFTEGEMAARLNESRDKVADLRVGNRLLGVDWRGATIYPSWTLMDSNDINSDFELATRELGQLMSNWELLGWFMSPNGYLDGVRPVDATSGQVSMAVRVELDV